MQSVFRGWLMRREFLRKKEPTTKIQSLIFTCLKTFNSHKDAAIVIQRYARGYITRKRLLDGLLEKQRLRGGIVLQ
uniref:Abnormal spindle-like microcephaly-associated protein homolog isoform X1 n=1 Tax=Tanacetum cinerariifolium TaxID=118510 RepID=A0A699W4H0_TANCI|nr:abnormal spindle-like microcephaly-associated protein homolog isoform X1 [Tanacetum cinerariifolium]